LKDGAGVIGEPSSMKCLTSPAPQVVCDPGWRDAIGTSLNRL